MPKPTILISIKTHIDTSSKDFGRSFFEILCEEDERFIPQFLSTSENYQDPFVDLEKLLVDWWAPPVVRRINGRVLNESVEGMSWMRKSAVVSRGMVEHGTVNLKGFKFPSSLWFNSKWARHVDFGHLFEAWVELSRPEIGMLHLFTDDETASLKSPEGTSFKVGSLGGSAKPTIPNIGWAMVYGESYKSELDTASIEEAGFKVKVVGGATIVQVTEKISDVVDDFANFSQRRAELKSLFRPDLFRIKDEPKLV